MSKQITATTIDNPFNPFEDFISWLMYDTEKGYYTSNKLARLTNFEEGMTEEEESKAVEKGVNELISIDPLGIYIKVESKK